MSLLKSTLDANAFACILEFVPKPSAARFATLETLMARQQLCGWPMTVAIGDRVGSALDLSPLDAFTSLQQPVPALLHFSGKDRERRDLLAQLQRMDAAGLDQLLLLTGDRLPGHTPGQRPVRYLESVAALQIARQARPHWLLAAALNPFKYREAEGGAQYFKAQKKLAAGADLLILQLGFDMAKHQEALDWMQRQPQPKPLMACIMALTDGRAAMLEQVAGVTVTPSMRALLAAEAAVSKQYAKERGNHRLALQVIGLRLMGYAGVHLSGIHDVEQFEALEQAITALQPLYQDLDSWAQAWLDAWQQPGTAPVTFHPPGQDWRLGQRQISESTKEKARYHLLSAMHHQLFSRSTALSKAFGWAVTRPLWANSTAAQWLHQLERRIKRPMVGCDTCGSCRLEDTLYICPETCPKGLANGPCGGTRLDRCEFGDRECVHSAKYRLAVGVGRTEVLVERLIPCVQVEGRQRSSWPGWFAPGATERPGTQPAAATECND
ncbi:methylenetetrahydrofolate reductase C-terminal domain-containing protein [Pseudomonas xanthosomatis]|uniref:methylenetetrahydrofolate reductase C-terminal domain-containing protein n=1 Tax=Pseudomonas xanthosomatis TaxID=2842356 RepID=UPI001C3D03AC|nr:methylenetetrahydrofolate reductase C-terminal domain-containing protein [Pseudomonas xanthosomatis]QXH47730.1 methylenetetrahydrofolate reductase C-terminal domain-containing protein [Pseudomonas xanthosomatis]